MQLVIFFWLLAAVPFLGGLAKGEFAWVLVGGALAIVALAVAVLVLTGALVRRGRR